MYNINNTNTTNANLYKPSLKYSGKGRKSPEGSQHKRNGTLISSSDNTKSSKEPPIKITGHGPFNSLRQVLHNMTPDQPHPTDPVHQTISICSTDVYSGNNGNTCEGSTGYRSGGTGSNIIGTTP